MEQLLAYVKSDGRVCPKPDKWNQLYKLLPYKKRKGAGWEPPLPLILAAWHHTSDYQKRDRLEVHIQYATDKGALDRAAGYLYGLTEDQWIHEGDV